MAVTHSEDRHLDPDEARELLHFVPPEQLPGSLRSMIAPPRLTGAVALGSWLGFSVVMAGLSLVGSTSELLLHPNGMVVMLLAVVAGVLTGGLAGWNRAWRKGRLLDARIQAELPLHAFVLPGPEGRLLHHVAEPQYRLDAAWQRLVDSSVRLGEAWDEVKTGASLTAEVATLSAGAGQDGDEGAGADALAAAWGEARRLRRAHLQLEALLGAARDSLDSGRERAPFHLDLTDVVGAVEEHVAQVDGLLSRVPGRVAG